jgi:hypothetical protein
MGTVVNGISNPEKLDFERLSDQFLFISVHLR